MFTGIVAAVGRIEKIEPFFNGGLLVELKGGEKIEISRRQSVKFKEMMSF
jgi:two-component system LytT family response regulator